MTDQLPTKLKNEPLIDAIFELRFSSSDELRFSSSDSASNILPGFLFGALEGEKKIERLPVAEMPKQLRDSDPNLQFAPQIRLLWTDYVISIGDHNLSIGCKYPYPGWDAFKKAILEIIDVLKGIQFIQTVNRFSMKYIDIIPAKDLQEQVSLINTSIVIGGHTLEKEHFALRIDIPEGETIIHIVNVTSSAVAKLQDGSTKNGIIVDIDTIAAVQNQEFGQWIGELPEKLDITHLANKKMFFKCLNPQTVDSLGPVYE